AYSDWRAGPRSHAAGPCRPPADSAATISSLGDNSTPAWQLHLSIAVPHCRLAPLPQPAPAHGCSCSSSSTRPPMAGGLSLRGHFYSVREGTLSKSFNTSTSGTCQDWIEMSPSLTE